MFDSLKKRLKEVLSKASEAIIRKEERTEETLPEKPAEASIGKKEEQIGQGREEIKQPVKEQEKMAAEIRPRLEIPVPMEIPAAMEPAESRDEPRKKSIFQRLIKRVVEKKLSENDIEPILKELRKAMLESDVAFETAETICAELKESLINKDVNRGNIESVVRDALRSALLDVMRQDKIDIEDAIAKKGSPYVIMFFGFNGVGKTTTIAKFAHIFKKHSPVIAAGDTFRAASIEQLEEHAKRIGVDVVKHKYGADSAAVIFDAIKHASAKGRKLVLVDTAGRSHANANLMDELKKVVRVNKPDLKILVLDSLTGNDIYDQTRLFNEAIGVDGIVLTKADVYQKGGAALSAAHTIKKPILFLGVGQGYDDLKEFNAEEIVKNLVD